MFKRLKNTGIGSFAALAILLIGNGQANAAKISLDSEMYAYSNPNTCMPQLSEGKCVLEKGFNVEAFSAQEIGSPSAYFSDSSHFHASNSYEAQHFNNEFGLLGLFITLEDGGLFSLTSFDYQLRQNENAISDYTTDDTKILISTTFDPTIPVSGQFMEYSIGDDTSLPFQTLSIEGFEDISQVYIASSGDVNFDNINVVPVPEPASTLGLLTLGTFGAASILKRQQK